MSQQPIKTDEFYALRKAEGLKIDPRTAYVAYWYAQVADPYNVEDLPEEYNCVGRMYFARDRGGDWVWFGDLPAETRGALELRFSKQKSLKSVPFSDRLERVASAIGAIHDPVTKDELNDRARALEAAQAAVDALEQFDATVSSDRSSKTVGD